MMVMTVPVLDNMVLLAASPSVSASSSFLMLLSNNSVESWREYVPLVVSAAVIVDIAMGRPVANAIMKPLSQQASSSENSDTMTKTNPKERVDTERIAKEALDQAYASMELRRYLDENKTEAQRLQEIRQRMDAELRQVDAKLGERRQQLLGGDSDDVGL